jgi:2-phospho-L-lactate guanylyltransferase (CobY/MobA/RfbA family)
MPTLTAIIPAKQFRATKQRLTALLMQKERHDLATAMLHNVLNFVNRREFATLLESIKSDTCGADPHRDPMPKHTQHHRMGLVLPLARA